MYICHVAIYQVVVLQAQDWGGEEGMDEMFHILLDCVFLGQISCLCFFGD